MNFIKKNLKWVTGVLIIFIFLGVFGWRFYLEGQAVLEEEVSIEEFEIEEKVKEEEEIVIVEEIQKFFVDVKGAVVNPGVYEVEEGKKVIDVVQLAGGFSDNANTTLINLAKKVTSEMVIIIYTNEEVDKANQENPIVKIIDKECVCPEIKNDACLKDTIDDSDVAQSKDEKVEFSGLVNLNTAREEELQTLPGIGESKAKAIVAYREEVGEFKSIEELKEVTGIGESLYEKVKDYITV